jgi:hypothetical protein
VLAGFVEAVLAGGVVGRKGPEVCASAPPTKTNPKTKLAVTPNVPQRTRRDSKLIKFDCPLVPSVMIFPVQSSAIRLEYSFVRRVAPRPMRNNRVFPAVPRPLEIL